MIRDEAIRQAEDRFDAVAARFTQVYGMRLPRHVIYCAAFFLGLDERERAAAEQMNASGLFGVGEWFRDGALDRRPWADERTHGRFRRDPPEFVTFVSGNSDGSHWGLWYDDPRELPRVCVHNWARDSAETAPGEATLLGSITARFAQTEKKPDRAIAGWLAELVERERRAHAAEEIAAPHPRASHCVGGMGPAGVRLPDDWTESTAERERYEAYRAQSPSVDAWIDMARAELLAGEPGRALLLGRELHWFDHDRYRAACTELLVGAYRALGRDALAGVCLAHHEARDMPGVTAYASSSSPFHLAAARGDAATVARLLDDPRIDSEVVREAAYSTRSPAVQELLFARDRQALEGALQAALHRASPRYSADEHRAARALAESRARGETMEALLARMMAAQEYRVWRALRDHGDTLDEAAWQRDLDRLVTLAIAADGRVEPTLRRLLAYELLERAEALETSANVHWVEPDGTTLLHAAAQVGAGALAERLLARGAEREAKDGRGLTPRDHARMLWQRDKPRGSRLLGLLAPADAPPPVVSDALIAGDRVLHKKFGEGRIESVAGDGKLTITFSDGSRVLLPKFVERVRA